MDKDKKTNMILKELKKKSKKTISKDIFTEFFYLNKERKVIEFLEFEDIFFMELFLKRFIQEDFRDFISLQILNEQEEEIKTWYYDEENISIIIKINWGNKKQEISLDMNIENFIINSISDNGIMISQISLKLLNNFIIGYLKERAEYLAKSFNSVIKKI